MAALLLLAIGPLCCADTVGVTVELNDECSVGEPEDLGDYYGTLYSYRWRIDVSTDLGEYQDALPTGSSTFSYGNAESTSIVCWNTEEPQVQFCVVITVPLKDAGSWVWRTKQMELTAYVRYDDYMEVSAIEITCGVRKG